MAINFDTLPKENPFALPAPDVYKAQIMEAAMKKGKDTTKAPYLNLKYHLTNHDGKECGNIYDIMSESDSSVVQYKIGRFLTACGIPLVGAMELSDIAKLVLNKEIVIDVNHDTKSDQPKAQIDLFTREAYYPVGQFDEIYNIAHAGEERPDPSTFINPPESNTDADAADDGANTEAPTEY